MKLHHLFMQKQPEVHNFLMDGGPIGNEKRDLFYHMFPALNVGAFTPPLVAMACLLHTVGQ